MKPSQLPSAEERATITSRLAGFVVFVLIALAVAAVVFLPDYFQSAVVPEGTDSAAAKTVASAYLKARYIVVEEPAFSAGHALVNAKVMGTPCLLELKKNSSSVGHKWLVQKELCSRR